MFLGTQCIALCSSRHKLHGTYMDHTQNNCLCCTTVHIVINLP